MSETVAERVIAVIAKSRNIPGESISMASTFQDLGIDSLEGLNLAFELEQEFNIEIPNEEVFAMNNVREVVEGLEKVLAHSSHGGGELPAQT